MRAVMGSNNAKTDVSGRKDSLVKGGEKLPAKERKRQDSNLRGLSPFDFESNPLTARARLLRMDMRRSVRINNMPCFLACI